jgi:hypothetical protein
MCVGGRGRGRACTHARTHVGAKQRDDDDGLHDTLCGDAQRVAHDLVVLRDVVRPAVLAAPAPLLNLAAGSGSGKQRRHQHQPRQEGAGALLNRLSVTAAARRTAWGARCHTCWCPFPLPTHKHTHKHTHTHQPLLALHVQRCEFVCVCVCVSSLCVSKLAGPRCQASRGGFARTAGVSACTAWSVTNMRACLHDTLPPSPPSPRPVPIKQYIVQKDRHAQPTDSGSAAARPTLEKALGSVSMICPTCAHTTRCGGRHAAVADVWAMRGCCSAAWLSAASQPLPMQPTAAAPKRKQCSPASSRWSASRQWAGLHARQTSLTGDRASCCRCRCCLPGLR